MAAGASGLPPFHLAIPVHDLAAADRFYGDLLGCGKGRSDTYWIDLNFFGHQLTVHLVSGRAQAAETNPVDGDDVPAHHFGVVLDRADWQALADKLAQADGEFLIPPKLRFAGPVGELATMFLVDTSGNALEFKSFTDPARLFAS